MDILVAVDGGGSGCRAVVADRQGRVLGRGDRGPANVMSDPEGALTNVLEAVGGAFEAAGLAAETAGRCGAVLGLAGVNVGSYGEAFRRRLPFAASLVISDAAAALRGALGPHDGAAGIIGTGSVFAAQAAGRTRIIGGWGFLLGDQASGARLGRALLERALLAHDRVAAGSPLTEMVLSRFGGDPGAVVAFGHGARPADFAALAPEIFAHVARGDEVARQLVEEGVEAVEASLRAVMPEPCERICLLGGLGPSYEPHLGGTFRASLVPALGTALDGALALAVERFGDGPGASAGRE